MDVRLIRSLLFLLAAFLLAACTSAPEPIHYGHDACAHCRMTISDDRYAAELVTTKGKVYKFDSIECMAAYDLEHYEDVHSRWVTDFHSPAPLIPAEGAFFLHSPALHSPMGMNLAAFGPAVQREAALDAFGGQLVSWTDVLGMVASKKEGQKEGRKIGG